MLNHCMIVAAWARHEQAGSSGWGWVLGSGGHQVLPGGRSAAHVLRVVSGHRRTVELHGGGARQARLCHVLHYHQHQQGDDGL